MLPFQKCSAPPEEPHGRPAGGTRTLASMHGMGSAVVLMIAFAVVAVAAGFAAVALYRAGSRGGPDADRPGTPGGPGEFR